MVSFLFLPDSAKRYCEVEVAVVEEEEEDEKEEEPAAEDAVVVVVVVGRNQLLKSIIQNKNVQMYNRTF